MALKLMRRRSGKGILLELNLFTGNNMNYFVFFLGVILLLITAIDLVNTSLSVSGGGFITKRLSKTIWTVLLAIHRKTGARKHLELGGAFILVATLINWLLLIWASASLLFISQPDSLMNVESNSPTTIIEKIFYTGYTLSTSSLMVPSGIFLLQYFRLLDLF